MSKDFLALKSGTDIRGTAMGADCQLHDEAVRRIAVGLLCVLTRKTGLAPQEMTVCVGSDCRLSAARIRAALTDTLVSAGVTVFDCGLASTPAMFMTTVTEGCTAAVQITASHHPSDKNGLKFFTRAGGFEGDDITEVLRAAGESCGFPARDGRVQALDYMSKYAAALRDKIRTGVAAEDYDRPLAGFHIVVDAGNGVGGFYAEQVLAPLGADISGSLFLEPDGSFPNHIPNPENETAMGFIRRATLENGADFGVIFDTDVDRAACVDAHGEEINRNRLVALASALVLADNPGGTVVTDSVTSDGLADFIRQTLGGVHHRFRRGYKNVINEAIRLNEAGVNCPLAIETSGHAALRENYFLDDGAYLMTKLLIRMARLRREGRGLASLIADLREPQETLEVRLKILPPDYKTYGERVIQALAAHVSGDAFVTPAADNREGLRVSFDSAHGDGWLLLRMSVHDPILPVNIESDTAGGVRQIAAYFYDFIRRFSELDISQLQAYLHD